MPFHAALEPLKWLEGSWRCENEGEGEYPTIESFKYGEEVIKKQGAEKQFVTLKGEDIMVFIRWP